MANKFYGAISHIGGADGDLDSISTSVLSDGDGAMVIDAILNEVYFYTLDSSSSEVEDTTNFTVIKPDDEGSTPGKRWLLVSSASVGGTFTSTVTLEDTANGQILMNPSNGALEITRVGGSPFIDLKNQIADDFDVRIVLSGGNLLFQGVGTGTENMAIMKPNDAVDLYFNNLISFQTKANGVNFFDSNSKAAELVFSGDTLFLKNFTHSGELELRGEDAGGNTIKFLQGDPDGATSLYYTDKKTMDTFVNGGEYGIRLYASDSNSVKLIKRDPGGLQIQHQRDEDTFSTGLDVIETDGVQGEGWTGAVHGISVSTIMNQNYVADEEGGGIFNNLQGTGTATLWGQDNLTFGPTAAQATKIVGLSQFVANRHSGVLNGVGLSVTTNRQGSNGPTEIASTQTYTLQAGIIVNGIAGNASGTDPGFKYGMMIGNFSFGGWFPAVQSKLTYGMIIDSYTSGGIHIGQPYTGNAPYLTFGGGSPGDDPNNSNDYLTVTEESGAIVWRDPRQTDSWTISQNADNIAFIGGADNTGHVTIGSEITLTAKATGSVAINSLFHNSADGKLYWKDAAGTDHALY